MWSSGFFNSMNGDRKYNAQQMSEIFEGLITDGVYESVGNKMAVQPNKGMTIQIATGRGWFAKHWVNNDTEYLQTLEASDVLLNRYCAVCVRVDESESGRTAKPHFKYSEFATTPVKPTMERSENVKEYCLAYVYIKAGATAITSADIEDTRGNNNLCGWVTGLIEQLSTTTLFEQWTDIFNTWLNDLQDNIDEWYSNLQDHVNENTEVMLVGALPVSVTGTLTVAGWVAESGIYKQSLQVASMNGTKTVLAQPEANSVTAYSAAEVKCVAQANNALEFTAITKPTEAINVNIVHMGV